MATSSGIEPECLTRQTQTLVAGPGMYIWLPLLKAGEPDSCLNSENEFLSIEFNPDGRHIRHRRTGAEYVVPEESSGVQVRSNTKTIGTLACREAPRRSASPDSGSYYSYCESLSERCVYLVCHFNKNGRIGRPSGHSRYSPSCTKRQTPGQGTLCNLKAVGRYAAAHLYLKVCRHAHMKVRQAFSYECQGGLRHVLILLSWK